MIHLKWVATSPRTPSKAQIIKPIEAWLASLDYEAVKRSVEAGEYPETILDAGDTKIGLAAFPRPDHRRGDRGYRMIGIYPGISGVSTLGGSLLGKLREKASRYGQLEAPYLIAVNSQSPLDGIEGFEAALFGPEVVRFRVGPDGPIGDAVAGRDPHALWQWESTNPASRVARGAVRG